MKHYINLVKEKISRTALKELLLDIWPVALMLVAIIALWKLFFGPMIILFFIIYAYIVGLETAFDNLFSLARFISSLFFKSPR